jgi:hypothetical protein
MIIKEKRIFIICFVSLIILHIILLASLRIYPFIDLPMHLASATIYRHSGEPTNAFQDFYEIQSVIGRPNTFHLIFCSLKIFPTVEFANKVFMCFYAFLFPFSLFLLIKKCNGNWWYSLLGFLLIYNFNVTWGFTGYFFSIPLLLLFLYYLLDYLSQSHWKNFFVIALLLILLFFVHGLMVIISLILFMISIIYFFSHSIKQILIRSLPAFPATALYLNWWLKLGKEYSRMGTKNMLFEILDYYKDPYFQTIKSRVFGLFYWDNHALFFGKIGNQIGFVLSLIILVFFIIGIIELIKKPQKRNLKTREFQLGIVLTICTILIYILIPQGRSFMILSYYRFSVLIWLSLILLTSIINPGKIHIRLSILLTIFALIHFGLWANYFIDFQKENKTFTKELFPEGLKSAVLTGMIEKDKYRGESIYIHFPNYYIIWNKGIAPSSFLYLKKIWRITQKVDYSQLPHYNEFFSENEVFDLNYKNADYLLIRGQPSQHAMDYFQHFELTKSDRNWKLYSNTNKKHNKGTSK